MATEKLVLPFMFEEENRALLTLSDTAKVRLNPESNRVELVSTGWDYTRGKKVYPAYDPDSDPPQAIPYVRTRLFNPLAMKAWAGFWCEPAQGLPAGTALHFRLSDGTTTYYWKPAEVGPPPVPAAWTAVSANDQWNTHEEVAEHIAAFPVASGKIAVLVGLTTTDPTVTPWVSWIDLVMDCEVEWYYSLIGGSMIPELRESIKPPVDFVVDAPGGTKVSLLDLECPFNIYSVEAVYDDAADPHHRATLLHSYDATGKTITLSSTVARGSPLWIVFLAEPEVTVNWGDQDYVEVEKIPALVLDSIRVAAYANIASQEGKNVVTKRALLRRRPLRLHVSFEVVLLAENTRTLLAMMDQLLKFNASHPVLRWRDLDLSVSLRGRGPTTRLQPALGDKHEAVAEFVIENAYVWPLPEESVSLVERLNATCTPNLTER